MRAALAGGVAGAITAWAARGQTLMKWPDPVRRTFPVALGLGIGVVGAGLTEVAGRSVAVIRRRQPAHALRGPVLVGLGSAALIWLVRTQHKRVLGSLFAQARALDGAYAQPPVSAHLTGGPGSAVRWSSLGREGARFVSSATTDADVRFVMHAPQIADPIRIYVGYDSAACVEERIALAIRELERTAAFERSVLLVQATAGTGFANPTPVDIVEIQTRGDCASVAVSYGLLPSFLSLDRVRRGVQTQQLLLDAIIERHPRARILLYGESLGATVQQGALAHADLAELGIDHALWVGTPGSARDRWPNALCVDNPSQIPEHGDARVWLLEHDADPVVRMSRKLSWQKPEWLQGERGRGVPPDMEWKPLITHAQVLVDVLFATDVRPGEFQSYGHDYRADLGPVVTAAYGFARDPATESRLDARLRTLEKARAARIQRGFASNP